MENLREKVIQLLYEKSLESSRDSLAHDEVPEDNRDASMYSQTE